MHAARFFRLLSGAAASLIQVSQSCFSYDVDDFFTDSGWDYVSGKSPISPLERHCCPERVLLVLRPLLLLVLVLVLRIL